VIDNGVGGVDVIFCGIDWAERHHDVAVVDEHGQTLATRRIGDDAAGLTEVLGLLAELTGAGEDHAEFVAGSTVCNRIGRGRSRCRAIRTSRAKVADIVGLYLDPPAGAVVLSFDEKTQVQALDRPTSPKLSSHLRTLASIV